MNERELLKKMGLSDEKLRDLLNKLHEFVSTLGPEQKEVFEKCLIPCAEAAKTLKRNVTAKQLEDFIRERSPAGASICIYNIFGGGTKRKKKKTEAKSNAPA